MVGGGYVEVFVAICILKLNSIRDPPSGTIVLST